jgi:hypothetical protein
MIVFEGVAVGVGGRLVVSHLIERIPFFASARSLQIGDGVAVIAVASVAGSRSTILAGLAVFGDRLGNDALVVGVRIAAFAVTLAGAALIPAPVRAGEALDQPAVEPESPTRIPTEPRPGA